MQKIFSKNKILLKPKKCLKMHFREFCVLKRVNKIYLNRMKFFKNMEEIMLKH
jgi:hypothetical protein